MIIVKSNSFMRIVSAEKHSDYQLPDLPYSAVALEPIIDKQTMQIHHKKHHKTYLDNLLKEIENTKLIKIDPYDLACDLSQVPEDKLEAIKNNLGGFINHNMFWRMMRKPRGDNKPTDLINKLIKENFGSFNKFKKEFIEAAKNNFGSGWVWLCADDDELKICATKNQDNPLMGQQYANASGTPILGLDVWEHAYYLNYQNKRADYAKAWFDVVNWDEVERIYKTSNLETQIEENKQTITGGKGDETQAEDFDSDELAKGIETEMEHTDDGKIAKEIAMDHLTEDPKYYTKLLRAGL
jgi:Fe-Mn family superoxide dismutase